MRKTHPVNALKKLGIGLAFGAATIMSMPTSALACTQVYMGSKLTADGNTYYGRAEDFGKRYLKHYGIEPAHEPGFKYSSIESAFEYTSNKPTYRYSYVRDHPSNWMGRTDAYSEAGINEKAEEEYRVLMEKHGVPLERVVTHNQVVGWKDCPRLWVNHPEKFEVFKSELGARA